jgi:CubicO group peptidase (beta-lactamase class C family)
MNRIKLFQQAIGLTLVTLYLVGCSGARSGPAATKELPSLTSQPEPTVASDPVQTTRPAAQPDPLEQAIDEYLAPYVEDGRFSGSILIARGEEILVSKGYGMANREHDVPNTPLTKFCIGSITKTFTAMAILMLQEEGQLSVQDSVCDHIPACPEAWQPVTLHHLLTHTSGIPDPTIPIDERIVASWSPEERLRVMELWTTEYYQETMASWPSLADTLARLEDQPLMFTPGTTHNYCNTGYVLLGHVIERVSGKTYAGYLRENIFEPLNMTNTRLDPGYFVLKDRASGYRRAGPNRFRPEDSTDYIRPSKSGAAGALYSTVEDLYLWDPALYTETLLRINNQITSAFGTAV